MVWSSIPSVLARSPKRPLPWNLPGTCHDCHEAKDATCHNPNLVGDSLLASMTAHTPRPLVTRTLVDMWGVGFSLGPIHGRFSSVPTPELRSRKGRKTSPPTSSNQTITLLQQKGLSEQHQCTNINSLIWLIWPKKVLIPWYLPQKKRSTILVEQTGIHRLLNYSGEPKLFNNWSSHILHHPGTPQNH